MCDASQSVSSRRATERELARITHSAWQGFDGMHVRSYMVPENGDVRCVCLQTGDFGQFVDLPEAFCEKHQLPPNPTFKFRASRNNNSDRGNRDTFLFDSGKTLRLVDMPEGAQMLVVKLEPDIWLWTKTNPVIDVNTRLLGMKIADLPKVENQPHVHAGVLAAAKAHTSALIGTSLGILVIALGIALT